MVKLDKIDRKLLYELDKNARIPDTILAKRIGRSRESVRYRIDQLKKKGIITGFSTILNMSKIGYQGYKLYTTLGGTTKNRDNFFNYIKKQDNLFWLGVSEGAWDAGITFFAKNHQEFFNQKEDIVEKYHNLILKKDLGLIINVLMFSKRYILPKKDPPISLFGDLEGLQIDGKDKKVIDVLRHNARISLINLAKETKLTIDIVRGRMKKLKKMGIIAKYTVDIDYNALGLQYFKVFLYFKYLSKSKETTLIQYCQEKSEVINYIRQISPWDVELEVMTQSFQEFNKFIRQFKDDFADVLIDTESANISEDYILPGEKVLF